MTKWFPPSFWTLLLLLTAALSIRFSSILIQTTAISKNLSSLFVDRKEDFEGHDFRQQW